LGPDAIEPAFAQAQNDHLDGVVVAGSMLFNERARVGAISTCAQNADQGFYFGNVPYGLLMSYGPDLPDYFRASTVTTGGNPDMRRTVQFGRE
jgi:putative ABC transport system substrate-binding protein